MEAILTMAKSVNLVSPLLSGIKDERFFFSYGEEIVDVSSFDTSYWMAGAFAVKLREAGLAQNLCSPGSEWLSELPIELTGRTISEGNLDALESVSGEVWLKPSEAKIADLPAGKYVYSQVRDVFAKNDFSNNISLQWTHDIIRMNYEHRFFVLDGEILTGSPYLVDGMGYHKGIDTSKQHDAKEFAQFVLDNIDTPIAFTLDVAFDMDKERWLVIEGNRAWSSGLYGCDPQLALQSIKASCHSDDPLWAWKPDRHIEDISKTYTPLVVSKLEMLDQLTGCLEFIGRN